MTEVFQTINPSTGELIGIYTSADGKGIEDTLARAALAKPLWVQTPPSARARILAAAAVCLREEAERLANIISIEMGKPIGEALAEVEKSAWNCEHVADHGAEWLLPETVNLGTRQAWIERRPLGTVFAVMPWNFPLWQIFRFLPGVLMAGNPVILKHAPNVQGSAENAVAILRNAGLPPGVFQNLRAPVPAIPEIIRDDRIAAVTLTGSGRAGAAVASVAGAAMKKSVLELGGADPFIVLADADIAAAASAGVAGRFANCGQVCLAPKRFILEASIADAFLAAFMEKTRALRVGDPLDPGTMMGPMARADLRDELHRQVTETVAAGAELVMGGEPMAGDGAFYPPTIVTQVAPDTPLGTEEAFGPVAAFMVVENAEEAIRLANQTAFGLSSNIWTRDTSKARALASEIKAGGVFINATSASDPRLPVGGIKASGFGRELGPWGFHEFVNLQTVVEG